MNKINWKNTQCQEVTGTSPIEGKLIECGRPGTMVIWHNHDGRNVYVMCDICGYHNIRNRGGIQLIEKPYRPTYGSTLRNYFTQLDAAELEMRTTVHLMEEAGMEIIGDEALSTEEQWKKFKELYKNKYGYSFMKRYSGGLEDD